MKTKHLFTTLCCSGLLMAYADQSCSADVLFDTEILSLNLSGGPFPMPLASDPGNALGDSISGYGFVNSSVQMTTSSQRTSSPGPQSLGQACAGGPCSGAPVDPNALDGTSFFVSSFFDVYFDLVITDVDSRPGRDYAGQPDGASIQLQDVLMSNLQSFYAATFDKTQESFDLLMPPETDPHISASIADIPLGADINGNGTNDKLVLPLFFYSAWNSGRVDTTLITNQLWHHEYDAGAVLEGSVGDVTSSGTVPFVIGAQLPNGLPDPAAFGGRDKVESKLVNPLVPEPASAALMGFGGLFLIRRRLSFRPRSVDRPGHNMGGRL